MFRRRPTPARPLPSQRLLVEELEPRVLFSADAEAVLPGAIWQPDQATPQAAQSTLLVSHQVQGAGVASASDAQASAPRHEVAFVDGGIDDADGLIALLRQQADSDGRVLDIVRLDANADGLQQIGDWLAHHTELDAVHVFSHGQAGALQLGSSVLDGATLAERAGDIAQWSQAFSADGDLMLYGCDLAANADGRQLLSDLSLLTGADVAASTDRTGAAQLGGDWVLEQKTGQIESAVALGEGLQQRWQGVLTTLSLQEGVSGYAGTVDTYISTSMGVADNTDRAESTTLAAGEDGTGGQARMFLKFDVSAIPQGSIINSVTMYLQITTSNTFTSATFDFNKVLTSWSESDTWGDINGTFPESPNGVSVSTTTDASLTDGGAKNYTIASTSNLVSTVQGWVNNASTNHGWFTTNGGYQSRNSFASSENATSSYRPKLVIDYTLPTPPSLDLDANNSSGATGNNHSGAYTENTPVAIADVADATITAGTGTLSGMTVALTNRPDGALESLSFTQGSTPITGSYNSGTGVLTLSGNATAAQYQDVLRSVRYDNSSDNPSTTARSLTVTLSDVYGQTASATSSLSVTRVNDAPTIGSNGGGSSATVYVNETRTAVTTVTSTDPDSGSLTYSISGGADASKFGINSSTGVLTFNTAPDYEAPTDVGADNIYNVIVQVSDGSLTDTQSLAVNVVDMPSTLVVTTTADTNDTGLGSSFTAEQLNAVAGGTDGLVSLREAMIAANTTTGLNTITFNIATGGVDAYGAYVITTTSLLPTITEAVVINATTQPGTVAAGHPLIVLDGNGAAAYGLQLSGTSDGSTIRGLVIRDFTSYGIYLPGGSDSQTIMGNYIGSFNADGSDAGAANANDSAGVYSLGANLVLGGTSSADRNVISGNGASYNVYLGSGSNNALVQGNYLGTNAAGTAVIAGNGSYGLMVESSSTNVTIGGTAAGAGNVISGFTSRGAWITTTGTVTIQGNYIGTNAAGTAALGNVVGLYIDDGGDVVVGGSAAGARNIISGNTSHGIHVTGSGIISIQGNYIGVAANGSSLLGNGGAGVYIAASNVTVGGKNAGEGNLIAGNTGAGIAVASGHHNFFYRNSIHSNGGLGIDLGNDGVTANDYNDGDGGANYANNFPVISSVVTIGSTTYITGSIEWYTDVQPVYIELFASPTADASGHGEGRTYLGAVQVTLNASGDATFSLAVTGASVGDWITAVANIEGGAAGASEFSLAVQAVSLANAPRGKAIWNNNDRFFQYTADWNGTSFNPTGVTGVDLADDITMMAVAEAPTRNEIILIGSADVSGRILAVIWDGSTWSSVLSIPIASPSGTASSHFSFAVAYENTSGDAMLVWDNGNTAGQGLSYAIWNGSTWSTPATLSMPVTGEPVQLRLANQPGGDQMVLVGQTTAGSNNQFAMVWNGSSWGNAVTLGTNSSQQYFETQVAYESKTGRAMVLYDASASNSSSVQYRLWDGANWGSEQTVTAPVGITATSELYSTAIASDAGSNRIALAAKNVNEEVWLAVWDGSAWGNTLVATTSGVELAEDHPTMSLAFESQSGDLLAAYGKSAGPNVYYRTWSVGGGWSSELTGPSMGGTDVPYVVKLYADPHSNSIMMGVQDNAQDLHYVLWNGSSWGAVQTLETTTGETYRENFTYVWYENAKPVISNLGGDTMVHTTGSGAKVIDQGTAASVVDPDATGYEGGNVTVSIVSGRVAAQDVLGIRNQGNGAGQIGVSGANVSYGGVIIGTYAGGSGSNDLVITLNAMASDAAVTALVANITYNNTSGTPTVGARTVRHTVTDGMGVSSNSADTTVYAALANSAPTITSANSASVAENTTTVMTVTATDSDVPTQTLSYSIVGGNDAARFTIDSSTGALQFVTAPNHESPNDTGADRVYNVTVQVSDGNLASTQAITVTVTDVDEFDVGAVSDSNAAANQVAENAANGSTVGITAQASDADGSNNAITYSLSNNAGGRFAINASTGVVTVADGTQLNFESATSHNITVLATSADGSTSSQSFTINITDVDEFDVGAVSDSNAAANQVAENAVNGSTVGITAQASDADGSNNAITYSLSNNASGRFAINASTGVVTVADGSLLNYESATSHGITVLATSADGSTSTQSFTINITDVDEFDVGAVSDSNAAANQVAENAANGSTVGITAQAGDADGSNNAITYSLSNNAGGRFAINASTGVVTVADGSLLNYESATSHGITVLATSADGSTSSQSFTINLTDIDEFNVGAVSDSNAVANQVAENAANGSTVGITAQASDADGSNNAITYSLSNNAGGRFAINASTGVVTVADGTQLNYESAASHNITVLATSADGSTSSQGFTINVGDVDEFDVGAVSDSNAAANQIAENASNGDSVGITAQASDADGSNNAITYSLSDNAGGRFAINASTGVVTVANASLLDYETDTSHNITVLATSADGSSTSQGFVIQVLDRSEAGVGPVSDADATADQVAENAANGTAVGITAQAIDPDVLDVVSYTLGDDAGGRFQIDIATGVVTVADGSLLDREAAASHQITVVATSSDGSSTTRDFTINLLDIDEFDVGAIGDGNVAANEISENAANGSAVGVTAQASDADATTHAITYSLDDDAGGRFAIDASTGVVTVADGSLLDREAAASHNITVRADSADGSSNTQLFTINLLDINESDVGAVTDGNGAANTVAENATNGSTVGLTAQASDADATSSAITYSLGDDAGGRFAINASTGVVTVADGSLLDRETAASHDITVVATSADGSSSSQVFTIAVGDVDEFDANAVVDADAASNVIAESVANGTAVGVTAQSSDADATQSAFTYSLSNDAGGRFAIDASSGVVTVADASLIDHESAASHNITVLATSADGSTSSQSFTINVSDVDEFDVGAIGDGNAAANQVAENAANGSTVGVTAQASDADGSNNAITYSLFDDAGGRFAIDASTGVVTVADGSLLNAESAASHNITVRATSADGSTSSQIFTINVSDVDEFDVGAIGDSNAATNQVAENAANGSTVGITAQASDADATNSAITYTLSDDAGGRFAINASTGVVTVLDGSLLDRETNASHAITVLATSADGSTSSQSFTINLIDVDEFDVGAIGDSDATANQVDENAANGTLVGITAQASDADATQSAITYSLGNDAGGRFAIDATTGVITVANGSLLNHEGASSHGITVVATSADGSTSSQGFTIQVGDVNEFAVGPISDADGVGNVVAEGASNGTLVGVTAYATDADGSNNAITYSLSDDAGGRFQIDASTGVVSVANGSLLDREAAASHGITVRADSSDGSFRTQSFTVALSDVDEFDVSAIGDGNAAADAVLENAANGSLVGITAQASDADATSSGITYTLSDSAGGRFAIDAGTGVVTVANGSLLDHESATSHDITVLATSADGSTSSRTWTIQVGEVDEFDVGPVTDVNSSPNQVAEDAVNGTVVGVTAQATDADALNNTVTYSLSDDAGGRFAIDAGTGVVTVADASLLDREAAASHAITVLATSADGSTSSQSFTINLLDVNDNTPVVTSHGGGATGTAVVNENTTLVGQVTASDADGDALSYSIVGGADAGRFAIDAGTGALRFLSAPDHEAPGDADADNVYEVQVAVSDGLHVRTQTLSVSVSDLDETPPPAQLPPVVIGPQPEPPRVPTEPLAPADAAPAKPTEPQATEPDKGPTGTEGGGDESVVVGPVASDQAADGLAFMGAVQGGLSTSQAGDPTKPPSPSDYRVTWQGVQFEPDAWLVNSPVQVLIQSLTPAGIAVSESVAGSSVVPKELDLGEFSTWPPATGELAVKLDTHAVQIGGAALSAGAVWWAVRTSGLLASMAVSAPAWRGIDPLPILSRERDDLDADDDLDEQGAQAEAMFEGLRREQVVTDIEAV